MLLLVGKFHIFGKAQPLQDLDLCLTPDVHRKVGVRVEVEQALVVVDTARDDVAQGTCRAARGQIVGVGENVVLVQDIEVVRVAVVDILSGFIHDGALGDAGWLRTVVVVPGFVEEAGIDISVIHDIRHGGRLHEREVAVVTDGEMLLVLVRTLCGDEDYAVSRPGSVD